jgi:hypothetical protein
VGQLGVGEVLVRRQRWRLTAPSVPRPARATPGNVTRWPVFACLEAGRASGWASTRCPGQFDSPYRPGRSPAWIQHAPRIRLEVVLGGWLPGKGNATDGAFNARVR